MNKLSYLALGDSYTIGEAVTIENSFPYQLVSSLNQSGLMVGTPKIIATTGWTTVELQDAIVKAGLTYKFDLVTLLIGVNNQYRGESLEIYREEFKALLQTAIDFADGDTKRVFVLSVPDWGATPYAVNGGHDQGMIAQKIDEFNAINKAETLAMGISYTDVTKASRRVVSDEALLAPDGLHYSATMYAEWVSLLKSDLTKAIR